ncbi:hypothetical protein D9M68_920990 [compost metagenome]
MASASRRVLMAFSTAPIIGTPKCASNIAGPFGAITATVSPRPTPRWARAEARRMQRLYVSPQVCRKLPLISARRCG